MIQTYCREAKNLCSGFQNNREVKRVTAEDKKMAQYKRVISLLRKLSGTMKRQKLYGDVAEKNLEELARMRTK